MITTGLVTIGQCPSSGLHHWIPCGGRSTGNLCFLLCTCWPDQETFKVCRVTTCFQWLYFIEKNHVLIVWWLWPLLVFLVGWCTKKLVAFCWFSCTNCHCNIYCLCSSQSKWTSSRSPCEVKTIVAEDCLSLGDVLREIDRQVWWQRQILMSYLYL